MNRAEFKSFYPNGNKVTFIFPSVIVGGHEIMALNIIDEICKEDSTAIENINIIFPEENEQLKELIGDKFKYENYLISHRRMEVVHSFLNPKYIYECMRVLNGKKDSDIILIQGDVQQGSGFIVAAAIKSIAIKSYIPFAHTYKKMNAPGHQIKDFFAKFCYRLCNRYITISPVFKDDILKFNKKADVEIIHNFVKKNSNIKPSITSQVEEQEKNLFIIGRVHFLQKGHDILMAALANIYDFKIKLHIVGNGPDLENLKALQSTLPKNITVEYHGWVKDSWEIVKPEDLLIIPSRFEGVPLVMLEALERGIEIIAANRDGMKDYLPGEQLYDVESNEVDSLKNKIESYLVRGLKK